MRGVNKMFLNKYSLFEELYLEELEIVEKEMEEHPLEMSYVYEWEMLAELIKEIRVAKEFNF
jgi:hypothetical protein